MILPPRCRYSVIPVPRMRQTLANGLAPYVPWDTLKRLLGFARRSVISASTWRFRCRQRRRVVTAVCSFYYG
jgi:hypothetical protein